MFRITSTEPIADTGFLKVEAVTIEGPGGERARRVVVRHSGVVVVVPVLADGATAVLVRQYRVAVDSELLEVPAGKRDVVGEEPATTAVREMREEVGYKSARLVKIAEFYNAPGASDEYTHVYLALDLEKIVAPEPTSIEEKQMVIEHVALADTERLVAQRRLVDAKSIIAMLLARAYLAGDHPGLDT